MTQTFASPRLGERSRLAARLVVLAGALAGLFAMHGLGDHGRADQESHTDLMGSAMVAMSHGDDALPAAPDADRDAGSSASLPADDSPAVAMAGVCFAVLTAALVGLLLLRPRRTAIFSRERAWLDFVAMPWATRRDRDPPCPFELSIQRC